MMPRNKLQFGSAPHRPWPPSPHPHDSNEAILNYFRECFAVTYRHDVNSQEIQSLEFSFHGTGAMLYLATDDELCEYVGNKGIGWTMHTRLGRSIYHYVSPTKANS